MVVWGESTIDHNLYLSRKNSELCDFSCDRISAFARVVGIVSSLLSTSFWEIV